MKDDDELRLSQRKVFVHQPKPHLPRRSHGFGINCELNKMQSQARYLADAVAICAVIEVKKEGRKVM